MKLLFVNACVRPDSRTLRLCRTYLKKLTEDSNISVQEVDLQQEALRPFDLDMLQKRDADIAQSNFSGDSYRYAKEFADADLILIGAPYWDNSFPSALKVYLEHICVNKITFGYGKNGIPQSLCRAEKLVYITTAGGYIGTRNSAETYLKDMCDMFGIREMEVYRAEGLDIFGNDVEAILKAAAERF